MADGGGMQAAAPDGARTAIDNLIAEAKRAQADRQPWLTRWQELAEYYLPDQADYNRTGAQAEKRMTKVHDSTQIVANEMLAAALFSHAVNPAIKWFELRAYRDGQEVEGQAVKAHLERERDIALREMQAPGTGFVTNIFQVFSCLPIIGTGPIFTGWNRTQDCLSFQARHMGEIAIREGVDGMVEGVFREFSLPARQLAAKWGKERLSPATQKKCDNPRQRDEKVKVLHVVQPRSDRDTRSARPDQMPVASVYIELDQKHVIENSGWPEMPFAVPRWKTGPGESYGRGPGWTCLSDVKVLQAVVRDTTTYVQKMSDPNLLAPDDGFIGPYRSRPGGVSYYRAENQGDQYRWWEPGGDPNAVIGYAEKIRDRIRLGFYLDLFDFQPQGQPLTATEATLRNDRNLRLLGPLLSRLHGELLAPVVMRVRGLLQRAMRLPPPPPELAGAEIRPFFISPIAVAQRQVDLQSIYRAIEIDQAIAAVAPNAPPVADWEEARRYAFDIAGVPAHLIRSREEIAADKQSAAMLAQAQAAAAAANVGSQAALNVAKARQTVAATEGGVI